MKALLPLSKGTDSILLTQNSVYILGHPHSRAVNSVRPERAGVTRSLRGLKSLSWA